MEVQEVEHESPLRPIFCVKNVVDFKRFDEREECYILDFDPFHSSLDLDLQISNGDNTESEISILGEKGQVACRDYPHARYLCVKFPFDTTPRESYCEMCFCYVCDARAPCDCWTSHCYASHTHPVWKHLRGHCNNTNTPNLH